MASGNIYIDPDRVVDISRQIGKAGEELEALRRSIVPQVNDVISMSYPSLHEMPMVAYPLDSAQENISVFNYRAQVLAQDLRTAGLQLNQIAEAGRTMIEQLTRQATLFGAGGQGSSSGSTGTGDNKTWWQKAISYSGTTSGTLDNLIEIFKDTKSLQDNKQFQMLLELRKSKAFGPSLFAFGLLTDFFGGGKYDARTFAADLIGNGIGYGIGLTPPGRIALAVIGAINLTSAAAAWGQTQIADSYGGPIGKALKDPAKGLQAASDNADAGKVFDDFGKYVVDREIIKYSSIANVFGVHIPHGNLNQDQTALTTDTAKVIYSIPQFATNMAVAYADDKIANLNQIIQYSPLPPSFKTISKVDTLDVIQHVNEVADIVNISIPNTAGNIYRQVAPLANQVASMVPLDPLSPFLF